jgi:predicted dithiol-disulfide oxidoreductase (DUF899 family)
MSAAPNIVDPKLHPKIVGREEWLVSRRRLLEKEKALTRAGDELSAQRRELPWVKIDKEYVFDGLEGKVRLADLFAGRSQLIIKHFMFAPGQQDGCVGCSIETDHIESTLQHIERHDVAIVIVARAPLSDTEPFRKRMGWSARWVSSQHSDFNYDFDVSFTPEQVAAGQVNYNYKISPIPMQDLSGLSVFYRNERGEIFHTYSTFGRGAEYLMGTYVLLDITPKGRNEQGPNFNLTDWVRHHDRYGTEGYVDSTGRFVPAKSGCDCPQ